MKQNNSQNTSANSSASCSMQNSNINSNNLSILAQAANFIRCIGLDMVHNANSGHEGIVLGMADVQAVLWSQHINFQKQHPNRDRFILSAGHGSAMLYSTLYCMGEVPKSDLYGFRKAFSTLPGHPEKDDLVEVTTGPLGQGIAWAVGIAKAETIQNLDHYTYVIASDGDLMEGISHEACALAGKWKLNKLIVMWDDNEITIDGSTNLARADQIPLTFKSYNWNVIEIDGHNYHAIDQALSAAKQSSKPTLIRCKTIIGYGSKYEKHEKIHGKALDQNDINDIKEKFGISQFEMFELSDNVKEFWQNVRLRNQQYFKTKSHTPTQNKLFTNSKVQNTFSTNVSLQSNLSSNNDLRTKPEYRVDHEIYAQVSKTMPTRKASGIVLENLLQNYNNIVVGSADLGKSTNTMIDKNYIAYGIREHAMTAITGGLALSGLKACCSTFLVFTDYARPAIRMAALMKVPIIFIATHDSIGVGEDGPTHQPIEHLDSLRLIPNLQVFRPSNGPETIWAWEAALNTHDKPSIIVLSRQNIEYIKSNLDTNVQNAHLDKNEQNITINKNIQSNIKNQRTEDHDVNCAYIIRQNLPQTCPNHDMMPQNNNKADHQSNSEIAHQITLAATGSEVPLACHVSDYLYKNHNITSKVISVPSTCILDSNLSPNHKGYQKYAQLFTTELLVCIEASKSNIWYKYGQFANNVYVHGINDFGHSGKCDVIMEHFGFTVENITKNILSKLDSKPNFC